MIGGPAQHDAVDLLQVGVAGVQVGDAAIDDNFQVGEIPLEAVNQGIVQRRHFPVLFRAEALQPGLAGVHDKRGTAGGGDRFDKCQQVVVAFHIINADTMLDRDGQVAGIAHGRDAVGHGLWHPHQAGTKAAVLHPVTGAAAVEIDLIVAPLFGDTRALCQLFRVAAPQLQGQRMLVVVVGKKALGTGVHNRAAGDHFGIQQRMPAEPPPEHPAVTVGPVHHRSTG